MGVCISKPIKVGTIPSKPRLASKFRCIFIRNNSKKSEDVNDILECNICLESYADIEKSGTPIVIQPCGHLICRRCYESWNNMNSNMIGPVNNRCQNCRYVYSNYHALNCKNFICNNNGECKNKISVLLEKIRRDKCCARCTDLPNMIALCESCNKDYQECCFRYTRTNIHY